MKKLLLRFLEKLWYRGYCESGIAADFDYFKNVIENQLDEKIRNSTRISVDNVKDSITKERDELARQNKYLWENREKIIEEITKKLIKQ
jgi:hypothetical protein